MKKRSSSIQIIVLVLLVLAVLSTGLAASLHARYRSGSQETEGARVATFSVKTSGTFSQELKLDIAPNETEGWTVDVLNQCETAIAYTVEVTNHTKNLPLSFILTSNGQESDGILPAGSEESMMLTICWPQESNNLQYMGMIDYITVTVIATHVD